MLQPDPVCTWTRFEYPITQSLDKSTFESLIARRTNYKEFFYGRITESPTECILLVIWHSPKAHEAFRNSPQHDELLSTFKQGTHAIEPTTQIIKFKGTLYCKNMMGPSNEVRVVYFPNPVSDETKRSVYDLKGMRMAVNWFSPSGPDDRYACRGLEKCAWIEETQTWNGQEAAACLWIHHWKSKEHEEDFKATERSPMGASDGLLAVEHFEQNLRALGAVGWQEYHVDFEKKVLKSATREGTAAATTDLEVDALGVGLGTVGLAGRVEGDDLVSENVVAGLEVSGDGESPREAIANQLIRSPSSRIGARDEALLGDLGPLEALLVDASKLAGHGSKVVDDGTVVTLWPCIPRKCDSLTSGNSNKAAVVAAGGMCGLVSWAMIYPIDSAKSIYQRNSLLYSKGQTVEPAPKIEFFKRHMYRGLGVSMSRSCVVNAIFFSSFEFVKKHINSLEDEGKI
ncbi:hypothetical protein NM208_g3427 [Fusarium decemcellulare]|uniref:Uncharacterized protein n=1 Tax=Fusarium decemcellulare TaxID=57161 RepID=A0ACC1SP14_9HYPO|nr:hypothetical protein NM208_g3427 [Fusarium decemcellulare]